MPTRLFTAGSLLAACLGCVSAESAFDGGTALDDGGRDASVADGGGSDAGGEETVGAVFAISDSTTGSDGGLRGRYQVGASFVRRTGVDLSFTTKTVGPCRIETIGSGQGPDEKLARAGLVHLTGGKKPIDLSERADGGYPTKAGTESLWVGGEQLTATGDGTDVPAFSATLTAPSTLRLTAPVSSNIDRDAGLTVSWTGSSSGKVVLYFDGATATQLFAASCTYEPSEGTAQVPSAAFADFPAGQGFHDFYVVETSQATPTGWTIRFTASSAIVTPAGAAATDYVTFK